MGLLVVGICVAAAINLHGPLRIVAIVVAIINFGTLRRMAGEHAAFENHPAAPVWNLMSAVSGLGLLIYSLVA